MHPSIPSVASLPSTSPRYPVSPSSYTPHPPINLLPSISLNYNTLIPPSSPRRDVIQSVMKRISDLFRCGKAGTLLKNMKNGETYNNIPTTINGITPASKLPLTIIDNAIRRNDFFQTLETDMVVWGNIVNKTDSGLTIILHHVFSDSNEAFLTGISDLNIEAHAPISELSSAVDCFSLGDPVKALVISVSIHTEEIYLSLLNARLPKSSPFSLGITTSPVKVKPIKLPPSVYEMSPSTTKISFRESLQSSSLFMNPSSINLLTSAFSINDKGSLLSSNNITDNYKSIRVIQNRNWARESVRRGIAFSKRGDEEALQHAVKCYDHALEIDNTFVDAYTARGAAFVLMERFPEAIVEFNKALSLDPADLNAAKYLKIAEEKKADKEKEKWKIMANNKDTLSKSRIVELLFLEEKEKANKKKEKKHKKHSDDEDSDSDAYNIEDVRYSANRKKHKSRIYI